MDRLDAKEGKGKGAQRKMNVKILHGNWQTKHTGGLPGSEEKGDCFSSFWRSAEYLVM
jgi:hypothetical protein